MQNGICGSTHRPIGMPVGINNRTRPSAYMPISIASPPPLSPEHIGGSDLTLWLDASRRDTFTFNGNSVSEWRDRRSNGYSVSQPYAVYQPTYIPNGWKGNPVVNFLGSSWLYSTAWPMPVHPFTVAIVFSQPYAPVLYSRLVTCFPNPQSGADYSSLTAWTLAIFTQLAYSSASYQFSQNSGENSQLFEASLSMYGGSVVAGLPAMLPVGQRAYSLFAGSFDSGGSRVAIGRTAGQVRYGPWPTGTSNSSGVILGVTWNNGFVPYQSLVGYIMEVAVWSRSLTEFEFVGLDKYFSEKWNIDTTNIDGLFNPNERLIASSVSPGFTGQGQPNPIFTY
jgi:hypothetical protein